jgi:anti-sigma B factor antagonist
MAELGGGDAALVVDARRDAQGLPVIAVSGDLDISTADKLEAAIASIASEQPEHLTFNLSGLRFMDSAGIAVLLRAASAVKEVQLREPSPAVRRVLELTGLTDVLNVES